MQKNNFVFALLALFFFCKTSDAKIVNHQFTTEGDVNYNALVDAVAKASQGYSQNQVSQVVYACGGKSVHVDVREECARSAFDSECIKIAKGKVGSYYPNSGYASEEDYKYDIDAAANVAASNSGCSLTLYSIYLSITGDKIDYNIKQTQTISKNSIDQIVAYGNNRLGCSCKSEATGNTVYGGGPEYKIVCDTACLDKVQYQVDHFNVNANIPLYRDFVTNSLINCQAGDPLGAIQCFDHATKNLSISDEKIIQVASYVCENARHEKAGAQVSAVSDQQCKTNLIANLKNQIAGVRAGNGMDSIKSAYGQYTALRALAASLGKTFKGEPVVSYTGQAYWNPGATPKPQKGDPSAPQQSSKNNSEEMAHQSRDPGIPEGDSLEVSKNSKYDSSLPQSQSKGTGTKNSDSKITTALAQEGTGGKSTKGTGIGGGGKDTETKGKGVGKTSDEDKEGVASQKKEKTDFSEDDAGEGLLTTLQKPKDMKFACALNTSVQTAVLKKFRSYIAVCDAKELENCSKSQSNPNVFECKEPVQSEEKKCVSDYLTALATHSPLCSGDINLLSSNSGSGIGGGFGKGFDKSNSLNKAGIDEHDSGEEGDPGIYKSNDSFKDKKASLGGGDGEGKNKNGVPWGTWGGRGTLTEEEKKELGDKYNKMFVASYKDPICRDLVKQTKDGTLDCCDTRSEQKVAEAKAFEREISEVSDEVVKRDGAEFLLRKYALAYMDALSKTPSLAGNPEILIECNNEKHPELKEIIQIAEDNNKNLQLPKKDKKKLIDDYTNNAIKAAQEIGQLDQTINKLWADFGGEPKGSAIAQWYSEVTGGLGPCVSLFRFIDGIADSSSAVLLENKPIAQCSAHHTQGRLGIVQSSHLRNQCERPDSNDENLIKDIKAAGLEKDEAISDLQNRWDKYLNTTTDADIAVKDIWDDMQKDKAKRVQGEVDRMEQEDYEAENKDKSNPLVDAYRTVVGAIEGIFEKPPQLDPSKIKDLKSLCWKEKCEVKQQILQRLMEARAQKLADFEELAQVVDKDNNPAEKGIAFYKKINNMVQKTDKAGFNQDENGEKVFKTMRAQLGPAAKIDKLKNLAKIIKNGCAHPDALAKDLFTDNLLFEEFIREKVPQFGDSQKKDFAKQSCEARKRFLEDGNDIVKEMKEVGEAQFDLFSCVPAVQMVKGTVAGIGKLGSKFLKLGKAGSRIALKQGARSIFGFTKNLIKSAVNPFALGMSAALTGLESHQQYGVGPINGILSLFGIKPSDDQVGDVNKMLAKCAAKLLPVENCAYLDTDVAKFWLKNFVANHVLSTLVTHPFENHGKGRDKPGENGLHLGFIGPEEKALHKEATNPKNKNQAKARARFIDHMNQKMADGLGISIEDYTEGLFGSVDGIDEPLKKGLKEGGAVSAQDYKKGLTTHANGTDLGQVFDFYSSLVSETAGRKLPIVEVTKADKDFNQKPKKQIKEILTQLKDRENAGKKRDTSLKVRIADKLKPNHSFLARFFSVPDAVLNWRGRAQLDRILELEAKHENRIKADPDYATNPEAVTKKYDDLLIEEVIQATKDFKLSKDGNLISLNKKKLWIFKNSDLTPDLFLMAQKRASPAFSQALHSFLKQEGTIRFEVARGFIKKRKSWFEQSTPSKRKRNGITDRKNHGMWSTFTDFTLMPRDWVFSFVDQVILQKPKMMSVEEFNFFLTDLGATLKESTHLNKDIIDVGGNALLDYVDRPEDLRQTIEIMADTHLKENKKLSQIGDKKTAVFKDALKEASQLDPETLDLIGNVFKDYSELPENSNFSQDKKNTSTYKKTIDKLISQYLKKNPKYKLNDKKSKAIHAVLEKGFEMNRDLMESTGQVVLDFKGQSSSKGPVLLMYELMKKYLSDLRRDYRADISKLAKEVGFTDPNREASKRKKIEVETRSNPNNPYDHGIEPFLDSEIEKYREELINEYFFKGVQKTTSDRLRKVYSKVRLKILKLRGKATDAEILADQEVQKEIGKNALGLSFLGKTAFQTFVLAGYIYAKSSGEKTDIEEISDQITDNPADKEDAKKEQEEFEKSKPKMPDNQLSDTVESYNRSIDKLEKLMLKATERIELNKTLLELMQDPEKNAKEISELTDKIKDIDTKLKGFSAIEIQDKIDELKELKENQEKHLNEDK